MEYYEVVATAGSGVCISFRKNSNFLRFRPGDSQLVAEGSKAGRGGHGEATSKRTMAQKHEFELFLPPGTDFLLISNHFETFWKYSKFSKKFEFFKISRIFDPETRSWLPMETLERAPKQVGKAMGMPVGPLRSALWLKNTILRRCYHREASFY